MQGNSRLIIKSLPNKITEKRLRDLFSSHGTVTDCQLKYGQDGKFRKFAFVGFANDSEAKSAKEYFDNTFIDTARVQVEFCRKIGEASSEKKARLKEKEEQAKKKATRSLVIEIRGFAVSTKKKSLLQFLAPVRPKRVRMVKKESGTDGSALIFLSKQSEVQALSKKNSKFFGGCKVAVQVVPADDERIRRKDDKSGELATKKTKTQTADECVEKIAETGRLFVRNLPYVCTVEEIEELFKPFGPLTDVKLPLARIFGSKDSGGKKSKGIALVTYVFPEHALKAYSELDGSIYKGRMLHILPGEEKPEDKKDGPSTSTDASFKTKKAAQLKSSASQSHTWNALFLSSSAVADVLTDRLDTEKSTLLDAEQKKGSLGVRMALGETHLVRETREFLLQYGVRLDSFSRPDAARSRTVILVKNLPAKTAADELRTKFEKFSGIARVVLPPSGISALIEFLDEQEAKKAFSALAYSRFKTAPLYLEWAPGDVFMEVGIKPETSEEKEATVEEEPKQEEVQSASEEEGMTLFIKNLNFETTDDSLKAHFARIGPLVYANVAKKRTSSGMLSMGFGFVQYKKEADAKRALKELQGRELEGFALQLKLSDRQLGPEMDRPKRRRLTSAGEDKKSHSETKILVRNIPFQATQKEVESLFKTFGDLRFVRIPKKASSDGHRGFGFVDFVSASDASKALDALCHSTHLYGRRLVMEWATTADDTIEDLQKRVAAQVTKTSGRRKYTKKQKVSLEDEGEGAGH